VNLEWSPESADDLTRLYDFLASVNPRAAANAMQTLVASALRLVDMPQMGPPLDKFAPREVRRVIVDSRYELRYEIVGDSITMLRIFHVREDR
jgi:plasmid stabilization system protein ParE